LLFALPLFVDFRFHSDFSALTQVGLFRVSGSLPVVHALRVDFDHGRPVFFDQIDDPHVASSLLKLFFREMAVPLIPFRLYRTFLQTAENGIDAERLRRALAAVDALHQPLMARLFQFTRRVVENSHQNKMNAGNLAIVFAPNILRDENPDLASALRDTPLLNSIVQYIIEHPEVLPQH
jgi:hypothetical protein